MTTSITNECNSLYKYKSLTLYFQKGDVCCEWEMSGDKDGPLYWPKFFLDNSSSSFASWFGLLNRGVTKGPKPSVCSWLSLRHPVSNWLEPPRHLVILFSNIYLLPLFFRLFTQVHLLIDGSVDGQYITVIHVVSERNFWPQLETIPGIKTKHHHQVCQRVKFSVNKSETIFETN